MMNERIRELESTARSWAKDEIAYLERVHNRDYTFDEASDEFNKKFAELIVQECITVVQNGGGMCGAISSNNLKQHFGVEE
jgi:hypothetical protein